MAQTHNHAHSRPISMPGGKPSPMPPECSQAKSVVRTWSIQFRWLDRPNFYRSGLPMRTLAAAMSKKQVGQLESVNSNR